MRHLYCALTLMAGLLLPFSAYATTIIQHSGASEQCWLALSLIHNI